MMMNANERERSTRRLYLAANWKMNKTTGEAAAFVDALLPMISATSHDVVICPPFTALAEVVERSRGSSLRTAAQNMHEEGSGAFTGEVSAAMLVDAGAQAVVLGHSERRELFGESDEALARKLPAALGAGLEPILCVGESEAARDAGQTEGVLERQLQADMAGLEAAAIVDLVIAYEPIWAIGTGRTATPQQAQEAIAFIRDMLRERGAEADRVRILYGGSVKPANAAELMAQEDIDGALVGGASLDPAEFAAIVKAAG
jgi:triosephosphate isomerase (TIM)